MYKKEPQKDVACTPCMKVKLNDIIGLEKENQDRISYDNKNIDLGRSSLNLYVHGLDNDKKPIINNKKYTTSLKERILKKIEKYGATIRKDKTKEEKGEKNQKRANTKESVVAEGIIFQLSHELAMQLLEEDEMLDEEGRIINGKLLPKGSKTYQYFVDTYQFACERWGADKIVGAYIHLDEYTPHMHLYVVPLDRKVIKYRQQTKTNKEGKPEYRNTLNAKKLFSRITIKKLWKDYGVAMEKYGARVATGLAPKGSYEERTSMDAVMAKKRKDIIRMESEIKQATEKLSRKRNELEEIENNIDKLRGIEKMMMPIYTKIIMGLQAVFDKIIGKGKARVLDFEVNPEEKEATNQYGVTNSYTDWHYSVLYKTIESPNQLRRINADGEDYYKSESPLRKEISQYFFSIKETASMASIIKKSKEKTQKKGISR